MRRACTEHAESNAPIRSDPIRSDPTDPIAPVSDPTDPHPSKDGQDAVRIFEHWQSVHGYHRAKLDDKRRAMINRILRKYTVEDCCKAIDGCAKSAYHMGENPTGRKYNRLDLVLRDGSHVDQFMAMDDLPPEPRFPEAKRAPTDPTRDRYGREYSSVTLAREYGLLEDNNEH